LSARARGRHLRFVLEHIEPAADPSAGHRVDQGLLVTSQPRATLMTPVRERVSISASTMCLPGAPAPAEEQEADLAARSRPVRTAGS